MELKQQISKLISLNHWGKNSTAKMTAKIFLAKAIKQRIANYPWLDYEGLVLSDAKSWTKEISDFWGFYFWVLKKFSKERIDKKDFSFEDQTVLVFALNETLSEYEFLIRMEN